MAVGPASAASAPRKNRVSTKITAELEQKERMLEFTQRFGWRIHKAGAEAVDTFFAQIGVPQRVFKNWMNNRHIGKIPHSSHPSHHQDHPAATAQGSMTEEDKSPEAEVAVSSDGDKEGEDHAAAIAQGSMTTEEDKPPEAEVAVSTDGDGGKEGENGVSEVAVVIQRGMGHRARKPNKLHRWPEWITV